MELDNGPDWAYGLAALILLITFGILLRILFG